MLTFVSAVKAMKDIKGYAAAGRITFTRHARLRMSQRNVADRDVFRALSTASQCVPADGASWKVSGKDLDGDDLDMVVAVENGVIVVTVF